MIGLPSRICPFAWFLLFLHFNSPFESEVFQLEENGKLCLLMSRIKRVIM